MVQGSEVRDQWSVSQMGWKKPNQANCAVYSLDLLGSTIRNPPPDDEFAVDLVEPIIGKTGI